MANSVQLSIRESGVAVITLNAEGKKMNLLSQEFLSEFDQIVDQVRANPAVKGLVIISGKDSFIAGANLEEIRAFQYGSPKEAVEKCSEAKAIFDKIASAPYNTVAAIHGLCLGGGTELSLSAKFRIASNHRSTKIGLPEVKLGFLPGWGGTVRLPHLIGIQKAIEICTTGADQDAKKAWRIGLVDELVDQDKLLERAEQIALHGNPRRSSKAIKQRALDFALEGNPIGRGVLKSKATAMVKSKSKGYLAPNEIVKVIFASAEKGICKETMDMESHAAVKLATSTVSRNLLNIFFGQQESKKMPENFEPAIKIQTVGVIGAGAMGHGIAQAALYSGFNVVLLDVKQEALDKGVADIRALFAGLVSKGKMSQPEMDAIMAKLRPTLAYADMSECDIVVEAVAEVMFVKKLVRSELEKVIAKPFIFSTNTSSLSVSEMGNAHAAANERQKDMPAARHPENIVGLHFFNPVHKMPLVEVVRGEKTSEETVAVAKAFAMRLGKTTVVTTDSPGFIVNRILTPYMLETIRLVEQGVPAADIDKAMRTFGMPMGPLELMDEVGLDICAHVVDTMHGAFGERLVPAAIMAEIKNQNLLGKKGGKGIYLWDAPGGKKVFDKKAKKYVFNPEFLAAVTAPKSPKHATEIQDRLMLAMVNEAARCMEEGIVDDPSQLDLAMIFGTGFPPFRGGVLRYADTEGLSVIVQKLEWLAKVAGPNYEPAPLLREMAKRGQTFYR